MATHTINSENTPTRLGFSPRSYVHAVPSSWKFILLGPNVTKFLERWQYWFRFIERWQKGNCAVYRGIVRFLQPVYGQTPQIGDQLFWIGPGKDWEGLRKDYMNQDSAQQVSSHAYLEAFKDEPRSDNSELQQFCQQFSDILKVSTEKGKLDFTYARWYLLGLPSSIQSELFNRQDVTWMERNLGIRRRLVASPSPEEEWFTRSISNGSSHSGLMGTRKLG